mmetsp:Transcript_26427/g.72964  ORF Transcript_26427/g.72964 Transcript_26427/m.72964 type:complete len:202 (+) Transcript_26427:1315-1920(+)
MTWRNTVLVGTFNARLMPPIRPRVEARKARERRRGRRERRARKARKASSPIVQLHQSHVHQNRKELVLTDDRNVIFLFSCLMTIQCFHRLVRTMTGQSCLLLWYHVDHGHAQYSHDHARDLPRNKPFSIPINTSQSSNGCPNATPSGIGNAQINGRIMRCRIHGPGEENYAQQIASAHDDGRLNRRASMTGLGVQRTNEFQ